LESSINIIIQEKNNMVLIIKFILDFLSKVLPPYIYLNIDLYYITLIVIL